MSLYWLFLICFVSYFIGNLNFSVLLSRVVMRRDIRKIGSGNPGATNMLRTFGVKWGIIILLLDMMKGILPAAAGLILYGGYGTTEGMIAVYAGGLAAVIGHCFPIVFKFKGGKGVSTTVGVFAVATPLVAAIAFVIVLLYAIVFEYASISSLMFVTFCVGWEGFVLSPSMAVCGLLMAFYLLILIMHRKNVRQLFSGRERRASFLSKVRRKKMAAKQKIWLAQMQSEIK